VKKSPNNHREASQQPQRPNGVSSRVSRSQLTVSSPSAMYISRRSQHESRQRPSLKCDSFRWICIAADIVTFPRWLISAPWTGTGNRFLRADLLRSHSRHYPNWCPAISLLGPFGRFCPVRVVYIHSHRDDEMPVDTCSTPQSPPRTIHPIQPPIRLRSLHRLVLPPPLPPLPSRSKGTPTYPLVARYYSRVFVCAYQAVPNKSTV